jgi:hypothetical protein
MQADKQQRNEQGIMQLISQLLSSTKKKKSDRTDRRLWEVLSLGGGGGEVEVEVWRGRRAERG